MKKSKKRPIKISKINHTDNPKFLLFALVILILLLLIVIQLYLAEKKVLLAPEGTPYGEGNYGESNYGGTVTRQQTDDQDTGSRSSSGPGFITPRRPTNQTNRTRQDQVIPRPPIDTDDGEPLLRRISLTNEPNTIEIDDGEEIILDIESTSASYEFTFEILTDKLTMRTLNEEFNINKNEVVEITLGTTKIYAGIKELVADTGSIVLGLNKEEVEKIVPRKVSTGFYFIFIIVILSIAIIIVLFFIYRLLKKQKLASTPVPRIQQYRQFPGQLPRQSPQSMPAQTQQFRKT